MSVPTLWAANNLPYEERLWVQRILHVLQLLLDSASETVPGVGGKGIFSKRLLVLGNKSGYLPSTAPHSPVLQVTVKTQRLE